MKKPEVGQPVVWHDERGVAHDALVIAVWSEDCINLVTVQKDGTMKDEYGRQIRRVTSQQHKSVVNVHGHYWRFPEEEPNPLVAPEQT